MFSVQHIGTEVVFLPKHPPDVFGAKSSFEISPSAGNRKTSREQVAVVRCWSRLLDTIRINMRVYTPSASFLSTKLH